MSQTLHRIQHLDANISYTHDGHGPPIVFAHCSGGSHRAWTSITRQLKHKYTCYAPNLIGYGETSPHCDSAGKLIQCQDSDVIDAMVNLAGQRATIVGHSYGGAIALHYALLNPEKVESLILIEPAAFQYLENTTAQKYWLEISRIAGGVVRKQKEGNSKAAANIFMNYWVGRIGWWLSPKRLKTQMISSMEKIAYECELLFQFQENPVPLAVSQIPLTLISGSRSPKPVKALDQHLSQYFLNTTHRVISRAGHMSPFTHPDKVSANCLSHMDSIYKPNI